MTVGRRVYPDADGELACYLVSGDYGRDGRGHWLAQPPNTYLVADLSSHQVVEHEDRTITVSPSISVAGVAEWSEATGRPTSWHGFLEAGVWRVAS